MCLERIRISDKGLDLSLIMRIRVYLRKREEMVTTDVSGGGSVDLAMVASQERQRGLIEREILKNEK